MSDFYSRLSYTLGNEDWDVEKQALRIKPTDRVLCITASGDRPLHAATEAMEVISIDSNPTQNHLFELKKEAIRLLDYDNYLIFLGAKPGKHRYSSLEKLSANMNPSSKDFWVKNRKVIEKGVLYQGSFEKWMKLASLFLNLMRGNKIDRLLKAETLEEQQYLLTTQWETLPWRKLFDVVLNPWLMKLTIKDPSLYAYLDPKMNLSDYIYDRIHGCLNRHLLKNNFLLSFILKGHMPEESYPLYLTEKGHEEIKKNLDKIKCSTIDLISYVESAPENSIDCFSLSDVASYISQSSFERLMHGVYRSAKPGARFSIRQILSNHQIPLSIQPYFERDHKLETHLEKEDRCFIYRFMSGTIKKEPVT
jgi:S-adenosylmethionine-diacylglycerol 3-amino-3-carboxypropyl transferase